MGRIQQINVYRISLPLREPLCHAGITTRWLDEVFLTLTEADGATGFSEVRGNGQYATGQTCETVISDLRRATVSLRDCALEQVAETVIAATGNRLAAMLLEGAALDALARAAGIPLCRRLGRPRAASIPTHASIGFVAPEHAAKLGATMSTRGFHRIKIRVGSDSIDSDVARVAAVRSATGAACAIAVDANGAWTADAALRAIRQLAPFGIAWVEQPTKPGDYDAMRNVRSYAGVPIMADEGVGTCEDVVRLVETGASDGVHLKLEKCGCVEELWRAVRVARDAGLFVEMGLMDQGRLGSAFVAHVAAVTEADVFELWGFERVARDVATGFEITGGAAVLPTGRGTGVEVNLTDAEVIRIL